MSTFILITKYSLETPLYSCTVSFIDCSSIIYFIFIDIRILHILNLDTHLILISHLLFFLHAFNWFIFTTRRTKFLNFLLFLRREVLLLRFYWLLLEFLILLIDNLRLWNKILISDWLLLWLILLLLLWLFLFLLRKFWRFKVLE